MKTNCAYCGKDIDRRPCLIKKGNCYCDNSCQLKFEYENKIRNKETITDKAHQKVREFGQPKLIGRKHTEEYKQKMRISCKGINKGKKNGMFGKKPWNKLSPTKKWWEEKKFLKLRKLCLKRDDYSCVKCGERKKDLYCDHKIPYRICKEHKLENLQMLCGKCHSKKTAKDLKKYPELRN
jgi:hypothetical protein